MKSIIRKVIIWALGFEPAQKPNPYGGNEAAAIDQIAKNLKK